jgi:hypothetical protein
MNTNGPNGIDWTKIWDALYAALNEKSKNKTATNYLQQFVKGGAIAESYSK